MTRMVLALLCCTALLVISAPPASADVLLIEEVRQAEQMQLPANGMDKQTVRDRFGAPSQVHSPVGDPPITRWDYDGWSAYFEYDLVLFTVLHKGHVLDAKKD